MATRLWAGRIGVRIPVGARDLCVQPQHPDRLWDSPSLVLNGYGGSFPLVNRLGREVNHTPASSAEVENEWSYTSVPL
jgi:hypothetical protein